MVSSSSSPLVLPPLGLGCARFGSLTADLTQGQAEKLVRAALELGVTFFDTADIYGQGDSERWLERALRDADGVVLASKAGQRFSSKLRMIRPFKPLLAPVIRRLGSVKSGLSDARAKALPLDFSPEHLDAALDGSLRRLRGRRIDLYLLHNPTLEVIRQGQALERLDARRQQGDVGVLGVSADEADVIATALLDTRVAAIQVPLRLLTAHPDLATTAAARGVCVIVREVLGGVAAAQTTSPSSQDAKAAIRHALGLAGVTTVLSGTTRIDRLSEAAEAANTKAKP